ncbi:putative GNAT family N-acyltransferase [Algoriphagus boseongensis]|uniref:Putative GNAT family N-acyltransferase n=1 Tax=Algoriphagus boseongensis TaxID=1442587 RepID=A0A4R6T2V0_9BACT|nr:GNAT family N-acetyltransferase [Algoriphagus boseongensis]TDQ14993.1 putative GNAT family N-acyltransferase [Algoriphagus boseongensis]
MTPSVEKITDKSSLESAFEIRRQVFVIEQNVDPLLENDEFEESSTHFLAKIDGKAVGTARWRITEKGVKLERFAVLQNSRGRGVGQALVEAVLADISKNPESKNKLKYLNSQLTAIPLYAKFGFAKVGEMFEECNIQHFQMQLA